MKESPTSTAGALSPSYLPHASRVTKDGMLHFNVHRATHGDGHDGVLLQIQFVGEISCGAVGRAEVSE